MIHAYMDKVTVLCVCLCLHALAGSSIARSCLCACLCARTCLCARLSYCVLVMWLQCRQWDRALLQVPGTEGLTDFCYAQINDRKRTIDEDGFESWHIDGGDEFWFGDEEGEGSEEGGDVEYDDDFLGR